MPNDHPNCRMHKQTVMQIDQESVNRAMTAISDARHSSLAYFEEEEVRVCYLKTISSHKDLHQHRYPLTVWAIAAFGQHGLLRSTIWSMDLQYSERRPQF